MPPKFSARRVKSLWLQLVRPLLQLILITIFLVYFGLPAMGKFMERKVMVVESKREVEGIPAPTITVNARNLTTRRGWKGKKNCFNLPIEESLESCIKEETFGFTDVVKDVILGYTAKRSLVQSESLTVRESVTSWGGKYFTLLPAEVLGPNYHDQMLLLSLYHGFIYKLFISDPNYFVLTSNPVYLPTIMKTVNPNSSAIGH